MIEMMHTQESKSEHFEPEDDDLKVHISRHSSVSRLSSISTAILLAMIPHAIYGFVCWDYLPQPLMSYYLFLSVLMIGFTSYVRKWSARVTQNDD